MLIVFLRAIILYAVIIFCIRLMGKKQLGELQPSEFVVTIMLSNIATLPIEDSDIPLSMGLIPILTFVCIDVFFSYLSLRSQSFRRLICGSPKVIISGGQLDQRTMKELRYTVDDLMAALRTQQVFDISEVQLAVVETTGQISVFMKKGSQPLTPEDISLEKPNADPPMLIVNDGEILSGALEGLGRDGAWLESVLKSEGVTLGEVLLMTSDGSSSTVIPKKRYRRGGEDSP
jgi:uncharacterized membrane protein YcaP (DUF421 family)